MTVLALALAAAGCGGEKTSPCAGVQCGRNASCDGQSGDCRCYDGFEGDPQTGCERITICTEQSCSGHGECRDSGGVAECTCEIGYTGDACEACDLGYVRAGGVCLPDPCNADSCNGHGTCSADSAGKAVCACAQGYAGERCDGCASGYVPISQSPLECAANSCEPDPCNGHGTCSMSGTAASCACQTGWATPFCDACAVDYAPENGACINTKQVSCRNVAPANATSTPAQVTITYTTAAGWSTPADCAWSCDANYALENGACINSKQVACVDAAPAHATSTAANVTITYTSAGGWSQPAACAWNCDTDWFKEGNACINTKQVACRNVQPANATSNPANVTITYTSAGGWTQAAACEWHCNTNYALEGGACINSKQVSCRDVAPAHATSTIANVTVTYTTAGGWSTAAACQWSCNTNYALEGGACINSKQVACRNVAPLNATSTIANVTINYTTATGWSTPADCAWSCNTGYGLVGNACLNQQTVACRNAAPANATSVPGEVTITYSNGTWSTPAACDWNCNANYAEENGACINSKVVPCDSTGTPANATATVTNVTITYSGTSWSAPAACQWNCNSGYALEGGACINSKVVPCDSTGTPTNATATVANVTITYSGTSWSAPAACAWSCNSGFHQVGQTCVEDLEIMWCSIQPEGSGPALSLQTGQSGTLYGQVLATGSGTEGTDNQSPLAGMLAKACTSTGAITTPVDVGSLSCTPATFNVDIGDNDEYMASVSFATAGSYNAIFAFSGDDGATWTPCFVESTGAAKPITVTAAPTGTLFFSEYVEGSSNNKALEITNGSSSSVSLSGCSIKQYNGGSSTTSSTYTYALNTAVTLAPGESYVVCSSNSGSTLLAYCDATTTSSAMLFNGDDALALECAGSNVDVIGQIGNDPGSEWGTGTVSTADNTIRRKCTVNEGDSIGSDAFDPSLQWDGYAVDTFSDLGTRTCP